MNICIVGTGYVGLVSAACFAEMGNNVFCVDVDMEIIKKLKNGKIHIFEPGLEPIVKRNITEGRLRFSAEIEEGMEDALFVFICVGTPSKPDGSCDLSSIDDVAKQIGKIISDYKIIINKSTVPVGTADQIRKIINQQIDNRGLKVEFDVVSNPEFLKEGDAVNDFIKPDRVVVGTDNVRTAKLLETLYAPFALNRDKMIVMDIRSAEMTKYAANCMLATKISFINEVANICEEVGADIREVRRGIGSDSRIGYSFIYPGVGYGGACFPKDIRSLIDTATTHDYTPKLLMAVDGVNNRQKIKLADKIKVHFQNRKKNEAKVIALWGLSFKANTDDIRESAAIDIIQSLTSSGMNLRAFDPVAGDNAKKVFNGNKRVEICDEQYETVHKADVLAVITEWHQFRNPDFSRLSKMMKHKVIFDGRNLYSPDYVASLGFEYHCIGRS